MGKKFSVPFVSKVARDFNIENRAQKEIQAHEKHAAQSPRHPSTVTKFEEIESKLHDRMNFIWFRSIISFHS